MKLERLLGREEHLFPAPDVEGERVLVTGSSGSIGTRVCERLRELGAVVRSFDIAEGLDVTSIQLCEYVLGDFKPAYVIHLAAHKYATTAEAIPYEVANLNIHGTHYVCSRAADHGVRNVIVASTCKAVEPETVYGASKLVAERIALNYGYTVGRFFNVIDSAGNVFEIWRERMSQGLPLLVTPCRRYFISGQEAVDYIVHLLGRPPGRRYAPFPGEPVTMDDVVAVVAPPDYPVEHIPPRRGDRVAEPLHGEHESFELLDGMLMVVSGPHDEPSTDAAGATPTMVGFPAGPRFDP
jgi:UDP-N-acetylglucosamine 4,6-dehydratase/5-epimerase